MWSSDKKCNLGLDMPSQWCGNIIFPDFKSDAKIFKPWKIQGLLRFLYPFNRERSIFNGFMSSFAPVFVVKAINGMHDAS